MIRFFLAVLLVYVFCFPFAQSCEAQAIPCERLWLQRELPPHCIEGPGFFPNIALLLYYPSSEANYDVQAETCDFGIPTAFSFDDEFCFVWYHNLNMAGGGFFFPGGYELMYANGGGTIAAWILVHDIPQWSGGGVGNP